MKHDHSSFAAARAYSRPEQIDQRIRDFVPMVQRAAWNIFGIGRDGMEVEDLVQAGMLALTECARKHSGPTEDGFAAYAKIRVRGAMFDLVRRAMPDSRSTVQRRRQFDETRSRLTVEFGREASDVEVATRLGWSDDDLLQVGTGGTQLSSIDDAYDDSNNAFAADIPDPFEQLAAMDDRQRVVAATQELPERLQLLLQLFFVEELNLTEIAEVLEVSVPRVHQLRAQALEKMKSILGPAG